MPIGVTSPIILKPKKPRHTRSTPHVHAPHVAHLRSTKARHAPAARHSHSSSKKAHLSAFEISTGLQDNANELAALGGGSYGTAANVNASNGGTPWTGAYDKYGLPTGPGSGRQGLRVETKNFPTFQAYLKSIQPQINRYSAENQALLASTGHGSTTTTAPRTHVRSVPRTPRVTAPLQLTDSGLLGHDSHITHPPALSAIAPVTVRRIRH